MVPLVPQDIDDDAASTAPTMADDCWGVLSSLALLPRLLLGCKSSPWVSLDLDLLPKLLLLLLLSLPLLLLLPLTASKILCRTEDHLEADTG